MEQKSGYVAAICADKQIIESQDWDDLLWPLERCSTSLSTSLKWTPSDKRHSLNHYARTRALHFLPQR